MKVEKSNINDNKRKNSIPILTSITKKKLIKLKDGAVDKAKEVDVDEGGGEENVIVNKPPSTYIAQFSCASDSSSSPARAKAEPLPKVARTGISHLNQAKRPC